MSIQAVAWALEQDLPARPKLVLVSIANHADHTTGYCWLKAETIAREAACTTRSIYRFIGGLVRNGYIRKAPKKGEDGKQRANDYWLLFSREAAAWDWGAHPEADDAERDGSESEPSETPDTISSEPSDRISHGEEPPPYDSGVTRQPVEKHAVSSGPGDNGVSRKSLEEPSKTNPEKKDDAPQFAQAPRSYKPPPLAPAEPQGALHPDATKPIFVYQGTRAWDAWMAHKRRTLGYPFTLSKMMIVDGEKRTGWWFPTLFPPSAESAKESAEVGTGTDPPSKKTA